MAKVTCNECVCKFNQMLGKDFPCNCCTNYSEFIPIDEETYQEGYWLDDPEVVNRILDMIDEVTDRIESLDFFLTNMQVTENTSGAISYLKSIKKAIIKTYLGPPDDKDLPWK